ncbi:TonB-denpendent receptor [Opitutaceae bacterium TAV5]|nr:TonB-denpendent receptor [Opitutaceae bacterium TAV5]
MLFDITVFSRPKSGMVFRCGFFPFLFRVAGRGAPVALSVLCAAAVRATDETPVVAAEGERAAPLTLETLTVKGETLRDADAPFSVESFSTEQVRDLQLHQLQEAFRHVAGMTVRNYGLAGVADSIVLRGFGGGGHGGDIGLVIDGIPLNEAMSHADGYIDLNVIVPLEISGMTIFKGPVSALYGNYNRAGLIALETRKTGAYTDLDFSIGSDTTLDGQFALGVRPGERQQLNLAGQAYHTDGYRPQSDFTRGTLSGRWAMDLTPRLQVALSGRLYGADGDSASYLTREQFDVDPYGIDPRVQNDGSEKNFGTLRGDINVKLTEDVSLLAFAYGTLQDFTRWYTRPVSATEWAQREESYDREVFGLGASLNGRTAPGGIPLNWVAGAEAFRESTAYDYYDNEDRRRRTAPAIYDRTADLDSSSVFTEVEAPLHRFFKPWVGLRYDRFTGKTVAEGPETGTSPLGKMEPVDHLSPKVGVRSDVLPGAQLRASWSEGFALPSNFAKYATGAADLDPNIFRQTEIGGSFRIGRTLWLDIAGYRIDSSDEIATVSPGVYENYGSTRRTGFEGKLTWTPLDPEPLVFSVTYGSADSEVKRNVDPSLVGNEVSGVPDRTATMSAEWAPENGWGARVTVRHVGSCAVDAANSLYSDSYTTVDLMVSYSGRLDWHGLRYRLYAGVENVADKACASSVSLSNGYELIAPGPPRTLSVGAQLSF